MSVARYRNQLRAHAIAVSREVKDLLRPKNTARIHWAFFVPFLLRLLMLAPAVRAWSYRVVFTADGRALRRAAEHVLADLRDFCCAKPGGKRLFSDNALEMARRVGRREVLDRLITYLNLDEGQVQTLMEIDDGE